jgi:hypothetical protein
MSRFVQIILVNLRIMLGEILEDLGKFGGFSA